MARGALADSAMPMLSDTLQQAMSIASCTYTATALTCQHLDHAR
jgi:hypothetical protein